MLAAALCYFQLSAQIGRTLRHNAAGRRRKITRVGAATHSCQLLSVTCTSGTPLVAHVVPTTNKRATRLSRHVVRRWSPEDAGRRQQRRVVVVDPAQIQQVREEAEVQRRAVRQHKQQERCRGREGGRGGQECCCGPAGWWSAFGRGGSPGHGARRNRGSRAQKQCTHKSCFQLVLHRSWTCTAPYCLVLHLFPSGHCLPPLLPLPSRPFPSPPLPSCSPFSL